MSVSQYLEINDRLADELFGAGQAGRPVYVGAEDGVLARALEGLETHGVGSLDYLRAVVRSTLHTEDSGTSPFRWYADLLSARRDPHSTPPTIALLVLLSIAADQMTASDGMAAHNYYGRLMHLLDVPEDRRPRVQSDYQNIAEDLWGSLNDWLVAWEGSRGVPTAYAVGMRYVGLPMSQALVREHDRIQLTKIFRAEGLAPGFQMTPRDMDDVLTGWVTRIPSPLSHAFKTLWTNTTARERMLSVACLELEAWDGTGIGDGDLEQTAVRSFGDLRLVATLQTFFSTVLELNLSVPLVDGHARPLTVVTGDNVTELPVAIGPVGTGRLAEVSSLDLGSLLADEVVARLGASGRTVSRRPRRVVPLRWHDIQGAYVEVERVERGERTLVLAVSGLRPKLEELLEMAARPGYRIHESLPGLPDGWILVSDVQIMTAISGSFRLDFMPMVPRAQTSLSLTGGMSLPGNLRKWSSQAPPEVHAVAAGASNVRVRIDRGSRIGEVVEDLSFEGESAIVALRDLRLGDGEYLVTLYVDRTSKPASSALLRLRSSSTPVSEQAIDGARLVYDSSRNQVWPVSAGERLDVGTCIDGVVIDAGFVQAYELPRTPIPEYAPRTRPVRTFSSPKLLRVGRQLGDQSCMRTGAHRFQIPDAKAGRPESASVESECETCGIIKRFPTSPWRAKKKVAKSPGRLNVTQLASSLPPIETNHDDDPVVLFDAVCHLGSGSQNDMARIASYAEATSLFADTYLRDLEALGHIDVRRDDMVQPTEWGINFPVLVPTGDDKWFLSGRLSIEMLADLEYAASRGGGKLDARSRGHVHSVEIVGPVDADRLAEACELHRVAMLAENPALALAEALPKVTSLEPGLRRISLPAAREIERWDTTSASWSPTTHLQDVGAYRISNFSRTYCLRTQADVEAGSVAIANVQVAKHVANAWAGDSLVGFHAATNSLLVPRGADLPGLFARAAVIASGRAATSVKAGLLYQGVPAEVADVLFTKLST